MTQQKTCFVNCPHCGAVLEVVSPRHNASVEQIVAKKKVRWYEFAHLRNTVACVHCGRPVDLNWTYK